MPPANPDHEVAIVGAGFAGLGSSIALSRAGIDDHVLLEEGDDVGGTWHWNRYPGVAVDIPSFSYQFSFERRTDWSRIYAPGEELRAYAHHCADKYDVRRRIRFGTRVTGASWDEDLRVWRLELSGGGSLTARFVVVATGVLAQPKLPDVAGLPAFAGETMHTARWDDGIELHGRRVGIIGTGASAVQVVPAIASRTEHLTVFQRTPIWCMPKPDRAMPDRLRRIMRLPFGDVALRWLSQLYVELAITLPVNYGARVPIGKLGEWQGRKWLEIQVEDPETRDKLTPRYRLGCKRPSFHNSYLATFNRGDVTLETAPIVRVEPEGVRTEAGLHELDVLICATGFKLFEPGNLPPFAITGAGGRDLETFWCERRYQAYEGASVPGFPNLFTIMGPYAFNGASFFHLIESQTRHITRVLRRARRLDARRVEIRQDANDRYFASMLRRRSSQIFFQGGCDGTPSIYFDANGDVPFRPSTSPEVTWRSARFDLDDYAFAV